MDADKREPTFEGFEVKNGEISMKVGNVSDFIMKLTEEMVEMLDSLKATNYVSIELASSKLGPLELILQKTRGKTWHELAKEAEFEISRHKDLLRQQCNRSQDLQALLDEAVEIITDAQGSVAYEFPQGAKQMSDFLEKVRGGNSQGPKQGSTICQHGAEPFYCGICRGEK